MAHGGRVERAAPKPKTAREAIAAKAPASAPKAPSERTPAKVEVALRPEWLSASADGAVAALESAGEAGATLVDAWVEARNAAAVVEAANVETLPSSVRKAAKRALSVLRARNIAIPERAKAATASTEESVTEATFTPPDSRGSVSFTLAHRRGGDRAHIAEVIVRDEVGVVHAASGWMSRSQIKEAHQRVAESSGLNPINVPPAWVRYRIAEAKKLNAKSGALVPLGLESCKDLTDPVPEAAPEHPISALDKTIERADFGAHSTALSGEPEFRAWLPDGAAIDELIRNVGAALTPDDAKDTAKVNAAMDDEMKKATDRYFTPELRKSLAGRMRDAALSIRQRVGDDKAREVLGVARAGRRGGSHHVSAARDRLLAGVLPEGRFVHGLSDGRSAARPDEALISIAPRF